MSASAIHFATNQSQASSYHDFKKLYHFYYQELYHFTFKYGINKESAEEIVSDVFIKVWEKKATLNFNFSLRSYLYTSVRNQCIDHLRKNKKQFSNSNLLLLHQAAYYTNPEEEYLYMELSHQVNLAIDSLPTECKKIFKLSRHHGLKYKEISNKLNISIKTVEAQISKALRKLRVQLAHLNLA